MCLVSLEIRVNADTGAQVKQGVLLGAQGVGLTRTGKLFFLFLQMFFYYLFLLVLRFFIY